MSDLETRLADLASRGQTITYGALARDLGWRIAELTAAGCDIVRVACPSQDDADALPAIANVVAEPHHAPERMEKTLPGEGRRGGGKGL